MKRIILFRYHKNLKICVNRLEFLKKLNPDVEIYGLYGGRDDYFLKFKKQLAPYFKNNYCIRNKKNFWKWKNGDLSIRLWFKIVGAKLDFDILHIIEWDLAIFGSLDEIYKKIPKNGIGLTALTKLKSVKKEWYWTIRQPYKSEWSELLKYAKDNFDYHSEPYASLGPGTCLPKKFLEKYSAVSIPELVHDELRLPLFGQIFGFKLFNTGFYKSWFNEKNEHRFFNCEGIEINPVALKSELKKKNGRRAFHPFRKMLLVEKILKNNE